ncbi:Crp/Fnr family transcriptional regulator [Lentzea sp. NPDC005914]|uniref:Crp/Fnr family transcriptional regulator n=1 Tax=Lentzea sp. NPDC005914 TaxID=3154572 RepID=UPI0034032247
MIGSVLVLMPEVVMQRGDVDGSLLAYLAEPDRDFLLAQGITRPFAAGDVLLHEDDPSDHVLVITSGWVRVSTLLEDGQEVIYALRGPGDVLGDLAALQGSTRSATVRAIEPVEVVQFSRVQFLGALKDRHAVVLALLKTMARRLRDAERARVGSATLDVSRRLAQYLVQLIEERGTPTAGGIEIRSPLSQEDIARQLGGSRRAVARALSVLRARGVVTTGRKQIVVHRPDVLRSLAQM